MPNKLTECNLFASFDTLEEMQAYVECLSGEEKALATMIMIMTMNTCARITNAEE